MNEVSIIVPFCDGASLLPHCLERLQRFGEGADVGLMRRRAGAGEPRGKRISTHPFDGTLIRSSDFDIPADAGDFRLSGRKAVDALHRLPEHNRCTKGLLPGSAWRSA